MNGLAMFCCGRTDAVVNVQSVRKDQSHDTPCGAVCMLVAGYRWLTAVPGEGLDPSPVALQ